ncbi:MAG: YchF/TatD family DNA exonuclease [Candidatus Omnitrophica bacterium]|nr:YchF/TatD family DNA exonuclease [Candidatus Omnitrophota bacterium]
MLVDTHAHLDFHNYHEDRDAVIERAYKSGVSHIINVGVTIESSRLSIELARKFAHVYASIGIHPHEASQIVLQEVLPILTDYAHEGKVVALGEVGLDYYRTLASPEDQKKLFREMLRLSQNLSLPLILHVRDSYNDLFTILREELGKGPLKGVLHCFSGDERVLHEALSLGLFISFTGQVTYQKNDMLRKLVSLVPDERLLLETDSPFLSPHVHRGKRNEPSFLCETARCIADERHLSVDDVGRITTLNCHQLFGFPDVAVTPKAVYKIRNSLYINTTTHCTNECSFCARFFDDFVKGHNVRIQKDPNPSAVLQDIDTFEGDFKEVVFCGFGEPFIRLDFIKEVSRQLKKKGVYIRIDTNGHGNLIHTRNILPELKGLIDELCVSLNTHNEVLYRKICRPHFEGNVFQEVISFIHEAKKVIPHISITFLDLPDVDIGEMEKIAQTLGVASRMRRFNSVG